MHAQIFSTNKELMYGGNGSKFVAMMLKECIANQFTLSLKKMIP